MPHMDLYLVRHAIAYEHDAERWPDDSQRPLTPEGKKRFRAAARGLTEIVDRVEVVLSSPFVRAWQTAVILHKEADWPEPTPCPELESERPTPPVVELLQRSYAQVRSLALVGHEPNLHELAAHLLSGNPSSFQVRMRKGGVAYLSFLDDVQAGSAILHWLATPALLRKLD